MAKKSLLKQMLWREKMYANNGKATPKPWPFPINPPAPKKD
jgi:hypothetical protein